MKILAIQTGHNATVALAENGDIVATLSQEKCDNVKNSTVFPKDAIDALLDEIHWERSQIDRILICGLFVFKPGIQSINMRRKGVLKTIFDMKARVRRVAIQCALWFFPSAAKKIKSWVNEKKVRLGKAYLKEELERVGLSGIPVEYVEHHLCHARASFHSKNKSASEQGKSSLIFTMDGMGDASSATVTRVNEDGTFELLSSTPIYASLGMIYSNTTRFLGMKVLEHEYKVMGLAPYAKKEYVQGVYEKIFKPVITLGGADGLQFKAKVNTSDFYHYLATNAIGERFDNIAAAVQMLTEDLVTQWIRNAIHLTGIRRVYTGGGVFMNVKLNKCIQEMEEVEQAYFMPSCGDESNPIGACYDYAVRQGIEVKPLNNLYLGISYSDNAIERFIEEHSLRDRFDIDEYDNIEEKITDLLAEQAIVARFKGRCEWGARSLGNRSILAHPSYMESFYMVNDYIKSRDFWMPFAPSILDSAAEKYLKNYNPEKVKASSMITAFDATELAVKDLRAAIHQADYTLRPQVVEACVNPDYYRLIKGFESKTGVGAVMNTSLNLHGYPLVASPEQALMTFENSKLQYLALERFLIKKRVTS